MITNNLYLDISRKEIKCITVNQYEKDSRTWNVYFSHGGESFDVSTINSVTVNMFKPDNTVIYNPCPIDLENNCAVLTFDEQMCAVAGTCNLQMSLYSYDDETKVLEIAYSFAIKVIISTTALEPGQITSSSEFKKLNDLLAKAENTYVDVKDAVEKSEKNAKESEINAKQSEDNAKLSETNADNYSKLSKSYAVGDTGVREDENTDNAKYYYENTKVINTDVTEIQKKIKENTDDAKISADNAKASETASKTSEINAKQSELNAATSETNALDSETKAKQSEDNAKISEDNSKLSETNAKTYMDTSKDYMDNAETYMNDAENSKNKAKESEDNAKLSEINASDSATLSRSYAVGNTGTRVSEDTDNAKYYAEYAKEVKDQIDNKLKLTEFDVNDEGELIYTDNSATLWQIDDDGNLNWEVN